MKKYGLQLRIPPTQKKPSASKSSVPPPALAFRDDDEDDVEREISRQASKNKALQKTEEQHKKALEEDPSVFDYDGVYDEMKEKIARPRVQDRTERKSKYIETLMQKAKEREREHEIVYERKILKERSQDDHLFADKEKFVTSAYKKKLAERAQWLEEERLRQIREEKDDVTKKKDLSEFYFGLNKNVAFGAQLAESTKSPKQEQANNSAREAGGGTTETGAPVHSSRHKDEEVDQVEISDRREDEVDRAEVSGRSNNQSEHVAGTSEEAVKDTISVQEKTKPEQASTAQTSEAYKRSQDAVAAARERFLARKRAKEQP